MSSTYYVQAPRKYVWGTYCVQAPMGPILDSKNRE